MFWHKKRLKQPAQNLQHVPGYVYDNGAERFGLEQLYAWPLVRITGAGTPAGQLMILQPPQVRQILSLPPTPQQGVAAGMLGYESLDDNTYEGTGSINES